MSLVFADSLFDVQYECSTQYSLRPPLKAVQVLAKEIAVALHVRGKIERVLARKALG
jgi:hypothetical protein